MKNSEVFKQQLTLLKEGVKFSIEQIVNKRVLSLKNPVAFDTIDNEDVCIVGINEDLTVDRMYCFDLWERENKITDFSLEIQIQVLAELEKGEFNIEG